MYVHLVNLTDVEFCVPFTIVQEDENRTGTSGFVTVQDFYNHDLVTSEVSVIYIASTWLCTAD